MALVSGGRSSLNPNAPLFVPAAMRQVEDFSPEWWNLVTTSTWFRDYWLSQQEAEDMMFYEEENDVVQMLPDSIDLGVDEDILNMEAQFEEFLQSTETEKAVKDYGFGRNVDALVKTLNMPMVKSPREQVKYWEKPARIVSPKCGPRFIQQPR